MVFGRSFVRNVVWILSLLVDNYSETSRSFERDRAGISFNGTGF
jgi:hypothetical protein